jgi:colanic acid biosynthesis glycosyl transferase WcaI
VFEIAGHRHNAACRDRLVVGQQLELVANPTNEHDAHAVRVEASGELIGHINRLQAEAVGLANVRFAPYQPKDRLPELLATGDLHVVPLRAGLGNVSVPSKTYSILAAGRPILAAIDVDTEVPRILAASGAGRVVEPDRPDLFVAGLRDMLADPAALTAAGAAGRRWVEQAASPAVIARAYADLVEQLRYPGSVVGG